VEYTVDETPGVTSYFNLAYHDKKWAETSLATFICCVYKTSSTVARSHGHHGRAPVLFVGHAAMRLVIT